MKISGDAETSARTGVPTYCVQEEDRNVTWTLSRASLEEMAEWDGFTEEKRRREIGAINFGTVHPSWYEMHAIVARHALRNYLGLNSVVLGQ